MFLPLGINLKNKKILLVGAGAVARQKLRTLQKYTSEITLLAPELKFKTKFKFIPKKYSPKYLTGYFLVYACTNDRQLNQKIARAARQKNILANVCDDARNSDFISPAIYKKSYMSAAVFSDGKNVRRSLRWRDKIAKLL